LEGLASVIRAVPMPVLAIGGITLDRVAAIAACGAAGIAAVGLFALPSAEMRERRRLGELVNTLRARFDSAFSGS
jgi:thiamine-phosphate pyrophosphorylase